MCFPIYAYKVSLLCGRCSLSCKRRDELNSQKHCIKCSEESSDLSKYGSFFTYLTAVVIRTADPFARFVFLTVHKACRNLDEFCAAADKGHYDDLVKKANGKLSAPKTTAFYKQNKYFTIKLTNSKNKKAIYNAKLNIRVFIAKTKYYNFNGKTGANGQLKLLINLNPGSYKVMVLDKDPNMVAKQITSKIIVKKAPTKLIPRMARCSSGTATC